jgi:ribulose-phosphate 3-epimerase
MTMSSSDNSSKDLSVQVSASILGCDLGRASDEAQRAIEAGAEMIHADVMDGHFVPNISFGPDLVARVTAAVEVPVSVHLMVERPERLLQSFLDTGADRFIIHPESTPNSRRAVDLIAEADASPGICLNPGTPVSFAECLLDHVDEVLIMTVNPGWGGQAMLPEQLAKVRELREMIDAGEIRDIDLSVDGGIAPATARDARLAGANILVAGTALFGAPDPALAVKQILGEA